MFMSRQRQHYTTNRTLSTQLIRETLDATFDEVGNLRVEVDAVKAALKILGRDMETVKSELRVIKNDLKVK